MPKGFGPGGYGICPYGVGVGVLDDPRGFSPPQTAAGDQWSPLQKKAVPSALKALLFLYALASSARLRLRRYSRAAVRMASDDTSVMSQFSVKPAIR